MEKKVKQRKEKREGFDRASGEWWQLKYSRGTGSRGMRPRGGEVGVRRGPVAGGGTVSGWEVQSAAEECGHAEVMWGLAAPAGKVMQVG